MTFRLALHHVIQFGIVAAMLFLAAAANADEPAAIAPPPPEQFGYPGNIGPSRGWYVWHRYDPETGEAVVSRDPPAETWTARVVPWCTTYRSQSYGARPEELLPGERVNVFFNPDGRTKWGYVVHFQDELSQMRGHNHAWQVVEIEPGDRWFRASLWMGNEKTLDDARRSFWIDIDCEKWRDGNPVDAFPLRPGDHVWMTWVWQNGQRVVKRIVDAASCDALKARQERRTNRRLLDEGLPGFVKNVDGGTVKLLLFSTYWSQARQFKPGQTVELLGGRSDRTDAEVSGVAGTLDAVKFGGTYGSGPTDITLTLADGKDAATVAVWKSGPVVFLRARPGGDVSSLRRVVIRAQRNPADTLDANGFVSHVRQELLGELGRLSDERLREEATKVFPELERAAWNHVRATRLADAVAEVKGTLTTAPSGPEWLRDLVGNRAMRPFDRVAVVDLFDKSIAPKSGQRNAAVNDAWIERLAGLPDVEYLELQSTNVTDAGMKTVGTLRSLQRLSVTLLPVTGEGIRELAGLTDLRRLSVASTKCTGEGFAALKPLSKLENLNFHSCLVNDAGLAEIGGLTSLERLEIVHTKFTDAGAVHLAGLKNLRRLQIGSREATGAAVASLVGLPLRELDLYDGQASDEGLKHAGSIGTLRILRVYGPATDAGLPHVARLEKLEQLVLSGPAITDAGLAVLHGLKQLTSVELTGCKVSDDAVERLRAALPGATVRR